MDDEYYLRIKNLNIKHYSGETSYYSRAKLRPAEIALLKSIKHGSTILDVGCGSGRFSIAAAKMGFRVTGIDITKDAIITCKRLAKKNRIENIEFLVIDITDEKLNRQFDYVFCPRFVINAIASNSRRRSAIKNMYQMCKKGGKIYIESFNIFYLGNGPIIPFKNLVTYIKRNFKIHICKLFRKEYSGLFPGDIVYPANKVASASEGYAHLPSIFEIKSYLRNPTLKSIYEVTGAKKRDFLKPFRYSIWTYASKDKL